MSADGRLVRAHLAMLHAAWASADQGKLVPSLEALAQITALSPEEVQEHFDVLTDGWELRDGWLCNARLEEMSQSMQERFGPQLAVLRASWLAAAQPCGQAAEEFDLVPAEAVKAVKARGKTLLPRDFAMDATTYRHVVAVGYDTEERRGWLIQRFHDFARAQGRLQKDWQAALRNFSGSAITLREYRERFGYSLGQKTVADFGNEQSGRPLSAADRMRQMTSRQVMRPAATFQEITRKNNSAAMAEALARGLAQQQERASCAPASAPGATA